MVDHESGGRVCLIDEFGPGQLALNWFNQLGDSGEYSVPIKGGFVQWNCELLLITTNHEPVNIYPQYTRADNGTMVRTGVPEPSFYSRVDEHFTFDYHGDHKPTALFDNRVECALHAICTQVKG